MNDSTRLTVRAASRDRGDDEAMARLRREIDMRVAPVEAAGRPEPGAKGPIIDPATFVIGALSSQAAVALIGVLKAHFERHRDNEIEFEGPGGKLRLKGEIARACDTAQLAAMIERVLGET